MGQPPDPASVGETSWTIAPRRITEQDGFQELLCVPAQYTAAMITLGPFSLAAWKHQETRRDATAEVQKGGQVAGDPGWRKITLPPCHGLRGVDGGAGIYVSFPLLLLSDVALLHASPSFILLHLK